MKCQKYIMKCQPCWLSLVIESEVDSTVACCLVTTNQSQCQANIELILGAQLDVVLEMEPGSSNSNVRLPVIEMLFSEREPIIPV